MMMLSGKQKAQVIISLLEDSSPLIMEKLPEKYSKELTSTLGDIPELSDEELNQLLIEFMDIFEEHKQKKSLNIEEFSLDDGEDEQDSENEDDSFLFNEDSDLFQDQELKSGSIDGENNVLSEKLRSPDKIAMLLQQQSVQLTAFFLSECEAGLKENILAELPDEYIESVNGCVVRDTPIKKRLFEEMYKEIALKSESDNEPEDQTEELFL